MSRRLNGRPVRRPRGSPRRERPGPAGFATRAIHVGQEPDPGTGAVVPPVYQTTTPQDDLGVHRGFVYSRAQNPTRTNLEQNLASLEGGKYGVAFASGLAALA